MAEVVRTKPIGRTRGVAFPAFIHNVQYHYIDISVYSDGLIHCWGCVDVGVFRQKIREGWVVAQVPTGAPVSIHNLGWAIVGDFDWHYASGDFVKRAEEIIKVLNPRCTGLVNMNGEELEGHNGRRYRKFEWANGKPYRLDPEQNEVLGDSMPVFATVGSEIFLCDWFVYADGSNRIGSSSVVPSIDEIEKMFDDGELSTSVPSGAWINIEGIGRFQPERCSWGVRPRERVREALDKITILQGGIGSIRKCLDHFDDYKKTPSVEKRELLRHAYESIPEHRRCYCGDMDSQDWPIRRILYGREQWTDGFGIGRHAPPDDY